MLKQLFSLTTIVMLFVMTAGLLRSQTFTTAELQRIAKTKAKVAKLDASPNTKVIVDLEGGEQIKGTLSSVGATSFAIQPADGPDTREITYLQVKEINKKTSTGRMVAFVGLAAGAAVGMVYGAAYLLSKCSACME